MTEEAYVSFECAKLLKEKGFYGDCLSMYVTPKPHSGMGNPNKAKLFPHGRDSHYYEGYIYQCEAPTQQMAMRWLREVHNIFIEIGTSIDLNGNYHFSYTILDKDCKYIRRGYTNFDWNYEEACEAAIKYYLENFI